MRVFHCSTIRVDKPDTLHSRDNLDFGRGFYVTTLREQAVAYGRRFTLRGKDAVLNEYELDESGLTSLKVLRFASYDSDGLDFVMDCRRGIDTTDWDVVLGGVADDRVFTTVDLYSAGEITKEEALGRLVYAIPNDQACLRTQAAIDRLLRFSGSEAL